MNTGFFNPLMDQINKLFGKATAGAQQVGLLPKPANSPVLPSAYQVMPADTSLTAIAANLNVPVEQLVNANGGAKTLPPSGSYINVATPKPAPSGTPPVGYGPAAQARATQNWTPATPKTPSAADGGPTQGRGGYQYSFAGPIAASQNVIETFNAMNESYRLTGQYDTSTLPKEISLATVKQMESSGAFSTAVDANGNKLTPAQALNAYGFEFKNGQFQQTGKPVTTNTGGPTQRGQQMDNGKFVAKWSQREGKLVWKNVKDRPDEIVQTYVAPEEAANVGSTPTSVLDLNIASG